MSSSTNHQFFGSECRDSQSLQSHRCQNILYKAVFEHFIEIKTIASLLLASKSFQNSSFGADFILKYVVDDEAIRLFDSVLSPSSCFSIQFAPSLHIKQSNCQSEKVNRRISDFFGKLVNTKYLHLSLRSLTLDCVTNEMLAFFFVGNSTNSAWPQLQNLTLENCGLNDTVPEVDSHNTVHLRTAKVSKTLAVADAALQHISKLAGITTLNLPWCNVGDAGLEQVSKLSGITSLDLALCDKITDAGLQHVSKLSGTKLLDLFNCNKITDAGLQHVAKLASITSLNLARCSRITDVGLQLISKLSRITSLDLSRCDKITDAGIEHVLKLVNLTSLNLSECDSITVEARMMLAAALPNCNIAD